MRRSRRSGTTDHHQLLAGSVALAGRRIVEVEETTRRNQDGGPYYC